MPPAPEKITLEQAAQFRPIVLPAATNRTKIAWTVLSEKVREIV